MFQISAMANLEITIQAPLTRPGIKLEKITRVVGGGGEGGEKKKPSPVSDHFNLSCTKGGRLRESRLYFRNSSITFQHSNAK